MSDIAAGELVGVRDDEWLVRSVRTAGQDETRLEVTGVSELVRDQNAIFYDSLEDQFQRVDPRHAEPVFDETPAFRRSRLWLESVLRRTPVPISDTRMKNLRPRILIGDAVGLGKTLEVGILLAELIRRGRGERILVVTPRAVLEQFQQELWTRFAVPLIRLDFVDQFPVPLDHAAAPYLLLRTLRLNCLTRDYAPLWDELYEDGFSDDSWTPAFADWPALGVRKREWTRDTPLRSDYERRAALVEMDALAALMLGLTADHLALMFRAQFPVLSKYEYEMYFDNTGRAIARAHQAQGVKQRKDDYKLLQAYLRGEDCADLLERYEPYPDGKTDPALGFVRPGREAEMRAAYAEFA